MDLRHYLFHNRLKISEFARRIEYSQGHLCGIAENKKLPGKRLMKTIEKATNGQVTYEDLVKGYNERKIELEQMEKEQKAI